VSNPAVITPPAYKPVTIDEAKEWCRIPSVQTDQDSTLDLLIDAMTNYAEDTLTGRAFVERTLEYSLDCFTYCIRLPKPPLLEIVSVSYTDLNGVAQTVPQADYEIDTVSEPGYVRSVLNRVWPTVGYNYNPVRVRYIAGYRAAASPDDGGDRSHIPAQFRLWIQARLSTLYTNRNQIVTGRQVFQIPRDYTDGLLDSLIVATRLF
jgi:uncharacterized phiE125 gp8 family phage protein